MARVRWSAFLALIAGCAPDSRSAPFPNLDGVAALLVSITAGRATELLVVAPAQLERLAFGPDEQPYFLAYRHSLDALQIQVGDGGLVLRAVDGQADRAIPCPEQLWAFAPRTGELGKAACDPLPGPLAAVRLPAFDPDRCIAGNGCLSAGDPPALACVVPCVPSTPPEIAPPAWTELEPAPPLLTPCPPGWTASPPEPLGTGTVVTCHPPTVTSTDSDCPAGAARFYGGCERIGPACPVGSPAWAAGLPASAIRVAASATPGGDGSPRAPFARIADALATATRGATIAIAAGTYDEALTIDADVTLAGACVEGTVIAPSAASPAIHARGGRARVRDLTLEGGTRADVAGAGLRLDRVLIERSAYAGLYVERGGTLSGSRVVVRDGAGGGGASVNGAGRIELDEAVFERTGGFGAGASGSGATLILRRVRIVEPQPSLPAADANALIANQGARLEIAGGVVRSGRTIAVAVGDPGTSAVLEDLSVIDTLPITGTTAFGWGISIDHHAQATLTRLSIAGFGQYGLAVLDGATATVSDAVIRGRERPADAFASAYPSRFGCIVRSGGHLALSRVWIHGTSLASISADEPGSRLDLADAILEDVGPDAHFGLAVGGTAVAHAARVLLRGHPVEAVLLSGRAQASFTDAWLIENPSRPAGDGVAMHANSGAHLALIRGRFEHNGVHLFAGGPGTAVDLADVRFGAPAGPSLVTRAVLATDFAEVALARARFTNVRAAAIDADRSARVSGAEVLIEHTGEAAPNSGAYAVVAVNGAAIALDGAWIRDTQGVGVLVGSAGRDDDRAAIRLHSTIVTRASLGGFLANGSARIRVNGARFEENSLFGVRLAGTSSSSLSGVTIIGTIAGADRRDGTGLEVIDSAGATVRSFSISKSLSAGLLLSNTMHLDVAGSRLDLADGAIVANPVGVINRKPGFDNTLFLRDVRLDNACNFAPCN